MKKAILLFAMLLIMVGANAYDFEIDGYRYTVITSSTAEFAGVNPNYEGEVVIPEYVTYSGKQLSVNTIGEGAFQSYKSSFLRIPQHITLIKNSAFYNAQIDSLHFENSDNYISLQNTINRGPSMSYSKLGSVYIGRQINRTDYNSNADGPFYNSYVKNVYIGKTCSFVQELFQNCTYLEKVIVKEGSYIESISSECFRNCYRLKYVNLKYGLSFISSLAFYQCTSLDSIYIPSSVTTISSNAFSEAKNIKKVVSVSNAPVSIGETAFPGIVYLSSTLYVPIGTKSKYETTTGWNEFANIVETDDKLYTLTYKVDGTVFKNYKLEYGAVIIPEPTPEKEGYTFSGWSEIPATMPAHDVTVTGSFTVNQYKLTYVVDGQQYKSLTLNYGEKITPEANPEKEGYTFSGWSEIPKTMPAHDVTVIGSFSVNKYKLTYIVDGQVYKATEVDYGKTIIPEPTPTKEGYTFSGWSEIPTTMPAHDVTVTGTFTVNKYQLTYIVDGEEYKTYEVEYGATITPEPEPTKEGYIFSGWNGLPETMPAHAVIVTGTFTKAKYILTYIVDGEVYKSQAIEYGAAITPESAPEKEGYTFSGWSEIPATMPAHDVTVTGSFTVNKYILTYILDGKEYKTMEVEYGTVITPEPDPEKEGYTFSGWSEIPETMPARIVIITGSFNINSYTLTYMIDEEVYKQVVYEYGATITPEPQPEGDYVSFEWVGVPEKMPAHDVTVTAVYETGIAEIMMMAQQGQVRIYSPNGKKLNKLQKGLNIVVMQYVTTRKVVVK